MPCSSFPLHSTSMVIRSIDVTVSLFATRRAPGLGRYPVTLEGHDRISFEAVNAVIVGFHKRSVRWNARAHKEV